MGSSYVISTYCPSVSLSSLASVSTAKYHGFELALSPVKVQAVGSLKAPITTTADNIHKYFIVFQRKKT